MKGSTTIYRWFIKPLVAGAVAYGLTLLAMKLTGTKTLMEWNINRIGLSLQAP